MKDTEIRKYQHDLVKHLKKSKCLQTPQVEEAFLNVPRHLFLPGEPLDKVYSDVAIVRKRGEDGRWTSSSSQPAIMAIMLEQLDLKPGQRVLEIGTGTGFNTALIASIVGPGGRVVTVDVQPDLVEESRKHLALAGYDWVETVIGDGGHGYPEGAPYDRIILTVASDVITPAWREQLSPGGILVLPFAIVGPQVTVAFEKRDRELVSVDLKPCGFMSLQGEFAPQQPVRTPLGPDPHLFLTSEPGQELPVAGETLLAWLREEGQQLATGVTLTRYELEWGLLSWVDVQASQLRSQASVRGTLVAQGDLADQQVIPPLAGHGGEFRAMYSAVLINREGIAALMRPSGYAVPLVDQHHPQDDVPFELYVRHFGPGRQTAHLWLEYAQNWERAGRPTILSCQIRAIPAGTEYNPQEGEFVLEKPFTKLIIRYLNSA
jgi:protein-L-isoaspartate(D-aspartate) O-methyltransferase